jgi:hypothetical protein
MKLKTILIWAVSALALIAGTVAVLLPSFIRARQTSAYNPCVNFLRMIDAGKEQATLVYDWTNGTDCDNLTNKALVNQYIKGNTTPVCPEGGTYTYNPLGVNPVCTKFDADDRETWRHKLPE